MKSKFFIATFKNKEVKFFKKPNFLFNGVQIIISTCDHLMSQFPLSLYCLQIPVHVCSKPLQELNIARG